MGRVNRHRPKVLEVKHMSEYPAQGGSVSIVPIDGVIRLEYTKGKETLIPFRALDKGGASMEKGVQVWQWANPEMEIEAVTLMPTVILKHESRSGRRNKETRGEVIEGDFIPEP